MPCALPSTEYDGGTVSSTIGRPPEQTSVPAPGVELRPEEPREARFETPLAGPTLVSAPPATRRHPAVRWLLTTAAVLAVLAAVAVAVAVRTMPSIESHSPRTAVNDESPQLELEVQHALGMSAGDVSVRVDGRVVQNPASVEGGSVRVTMPPLEDGRHEAVVRIRKVGLLRRTLVERWSFTVDTTRPMIRVAAPLTDAGGPLGPERAAVTTPTMQLRLGTEPSASVEVTVAGSSAAGPLQAESNNDGVALVKVPLTDGPHELQVLVRDAAGNETTRPLSVLVDTKKPLVRVDAPPVVKDSSPSLPVLLVDASGVLPTSVTIDGETEGFTLTTPSGDPVELAKLPVGAPAPRVAPSAAGAGTPAGTQRAAVPLGAEEDAVGGPETGTTEATNGASAAAEPDPEATPAAPESDARAAADVATPTRFELRVATSDDLYEGAHEIVVQARDAAGNRTVLRRSIVVDSTEELGGGSGMRFGARGGDVRTLHEELVRTDTVTQATLAGEWGARTYGRRTVAAISQFQEDRGLEADGVAGEATIAGLTMRIVISRSANTLTLFRSGAVLRTYKVATGAAKFPTPAGDFRIVDMQVNPTWTPPDSEWARDAKPIPPGPDNPLGTRWMGLDSPAVGIHGTNSPASLGYSVSHGCIRMAIPEAEELFNLVEAGTPVTIT